MRKLGVRTTELSCGLHGERRWPAPRSMLFSPAVTGYCHQTGSRGTDLALGRRARLCSGYADLARKVAYSGKTVQPVLGHCSQTGDLKAGNTEKACASGDDHGNDLRFGGKCERMRREPIPPSLSPSLHPSTHPLTHPLSQTGGELPQK